MKIAFLTFILILASVASLASAANPQVTLQISGPVTGNIVLELYADKAPITTANFIDYVQTGFYDGLIFHRVMKDFMIQAGGFDTDLVYKTPNPAIFNESSNGLSNTRGTLAMARTTLPDSATSQFFINHQDNLFLDYGAIAYSNNEPYIKVGYCVFGQVISGLDIVDAIAALPTTTENDMENVPVNDVIIISATITSDGPICIEKMDGDLDGDCDVDYDDFAKIAENWLKCNSITTPCN